MVFNSLEYLFFLPITYLIFQFARKQYRWIVLLIASVAFYSALQMPLLIVALVFIIVTSYFSGLRLGDSRNLYHKKAILMPEVLRIIIAVLCIVLLIMLASNLYSLFTRSSEIEQAKSTLNEIAEPI
jgi:D-alanyl-lipoteichoic acid acyltransferase DltB (MBOAT superfamily)